VASLTPFDLLELFLYIFPIMELWLIQRYFRALLGYEGGSIRFRFAVVDMAVPFLLVSIHLLSVRLLTFSLLPHFLFLSCLLGLALTMYVDRIKRISSRGRLFSLIVRNVFLLGFLLHYGLVAARIWQLVSA